jgi:Zn-dependent peptidase ImmA (M78 family)
MMGRLEIEDFEIAARKLRIELGIDDQLRPDMITVVIKLKERGRIENYVRVPDKDMPDSEAMFDPDKRLLYIRESTFAAANGLFAGTDAERRRARYTIAHEIGHIVLGHSAVRHRGASNEQRKAAKGNWQDEREAEQFAAAFLAPAHLAE